MFHVGDTVVYGRAGVCNIVDIRRERFGTEERLYYVISPIYETNSTIYAPVGSDRISIRKLLTLEEIDALIHSMPDTQVDWIENDQQRKEAYTEILRHGDHREVIGLIRTLYFKREEKKHQGRKFGIADERLMKEAENSLYGEFAHVLKIRPDEVVPFIRGELESHNASA